MDLRIIETGNGGDVLLSGNDLAVDYTFETMIYLALFSGNPGYSTPTDRLPTEMAYDWWGNTTLLPNQPLLQFNSLTEFTLNTTTLNSAGRITIQNAVIADLGFMADFAEITVAVVIPTVDTVNITIRLQKPDNLQETSFIFVWDATIQALTGAYVPNSNINLLSGLQSTLQTTL
jgi:hypothetical protein